MNGIPDEFSGAGPGKVAHVFGFENPSLGFSGAFFFVILGFFRSNDEYRLLGCFGFVKSLDPCGFETSIRNSRWAKRTAKNSTTKSKTSNLMSVRF